MKQRVRLSAPAARRAALAAQGFGLSRPGPATDARHFGRVMRSIRLLQLDFVNVLVPAHYLVMWSRLGNYDIKRFERYLYDSGRCTEQWAHEASVVPVESWPLFAHRRSAWQPSKRNPLIPLPDRDRYLRQVLDHVRREGPVTAHEVPAAEAPPRKRGDWHRPMSRIALEYHFARGDLAVARRLPNFQRVYDLPSRVIAAAHLARRVADDDARRELLLDAAKANGVATTKDLADYYRMPARDAAPRIAELVESGELVPVTVDGWDEPAYLAAAARIPRRTDVAALLSPFDPLVWYRPRLERLFGFHYRLEIYTPAAQRKWGYYVLPFLLADRIVARVDLKADRAGGALVVRQCHPEARCDETTCLPRLAAKLTELRQWLHLDRVRVQGRDRFSRGLRAEARS